MYYCWLFFSNTMGVAFVSEIIFYSSGIACRSRRSTRNNAFLGNQGKKFSDKIMTIFLGKFRVSREFAVIGRRLCVAGEIRRKWRKSLSLLRIDLQLGLIRRWRQVAVKMTKCVWVLRWIKLGKEKKSVADHYQRTFWRVSLWCTRIAHCSYAAIFGASALFLWLITL